MVDEAQHDWEMSKENVQVLSRGRKVDDLNEFSRNLHSMDRRMEYDSREEEFETALFEYNGDDPLSIWQEYFDWMYKAFPSGSVKLNTLYDRFRDTFSGNDDQYRNDQRYVHLWLRMANACDNPIPIFKFMYKKKIGGSSALLYCAWALVAEEQNHFALAEKVLQKALDMKAEPRYLVKQRQKQFYRRMKRHFSNSDASEEDTASRLFPENPAPPLDPSVQSSSSRRTLGELTKKVAASSHRPSRNPRGLASSSFSARPKKEEENDVIPIFHDDQREHYNNDFDQLDAAAAAAPTNPLPKHKEAIKENERNLSKWSDRGLARKPIRASSCASAAADTSVQIYKDEELEQKAPIQKNKKTQLKRACLQEISTKPLEETQRRIVHHQSESSEEQEVHIWKNSTDVAGDDQSLEEVRAQDMKYVIRTSRATPVSEKFIISEEKSAIDIVLSPQASQNNIYCASQQQQQQFQKLMIEDEDMTFNTKSVMNDLKGIFQSPEVEMTRGCNSTAHSQITTPAFGKHIAATPTLERRLHFSIFEDSSIQTPLSQKPPAQSSNSEETQPNLPPDEFPIYVETTADRKINTDSMKSSTGNKSTSRFPLKARTDILSTRKTNKQVLEEVKAGITKTHIPQDEDNEPEDEINHNSNASNCGIVAAEATIGGLSRISEGSGDTSETSPAALVNDSMLIYRDPPVKSTRSSANNPSRDSRSNNFLCQNNSNRRTSTGFSNLSPISMTNSSHIMGGTPSQHTINAQMNTWSTSTYNSDSMTTKMAPAESTTSPCFIDPYVRQHRLEIQQSPQVAEKLHHCPSSYICYDKLPVRLSKTPSKAKHRLNREFQLNETEKCVITSPLGSGAFARVYSATMTNTRLKTSRELALKHESPVLNLPYEYYVLLEWKERMKELYGDEKQYAHMAVAAKNLYVYEDAALLMMEKSKIGTLHDLLNNYREHGEKIPENLVIHYTIQMLETVEKFHRVGLIHGDIKPDNWIILPGEVRDHYDNSTYFSSSTISMIDFGRSIDLKMYPSSVQFIGDCHTDGFQCIEMRENRPWTFQIDTFGICATVHCLLFGDYMKVEKVVQNHEPSCERDASCSCPSRWKIENALKRYWQYDLWIVFFDTLLNIPQHQQHQQPDLLSEIRQTLEKYLEEQSATGLKTIPELFKEQERMLGIRKLSSRN